MPYLSAQPLIDERVTSSVRKAAKGLSGGDEKVIANRSSRRPSRWLMGILAMVLAVLVAPSGPAHAEGSGAQGSGDGVPVPPDTGMTDKGTGPITAADKDFVIKVRLAGLWEIPAGNMAQQKSQNPRIVEIGRSIAAQHVVLDQMDRDAAKKLGIDLPNQPNGDQQWWLTEMRTATSSVQFDQIFVDRLRAAHGKIFPAIATIRASTRNDAVRMLAQKANQFVMTHMTLLESSGIVDYGGLPTAPPPGPAGRGPVPVDGQMLAAASSSATPGVNTSVVLVVLAVAVVAGLITTMRIFRAR
jgi:putative membrane protein